MQTKQIVKIIILFILAILMFVGGYVMFQRLSYNKDVFNINVADYVPSSASSVIRVNRKAEEVSAYFGNLNEVLSQLKSTYSYPLFLVSKYNSEAIMFKIDAEKELKIKNDLATTIYPLFQPKERNYKGTNIYFYTSENGTFLACIFHQGVFACSYNYKLLEDIIDTSQDKNFFTDNLFLKLKNKYSDTYTANLFVKNQKIRTCYNLMKTDQDIFLEGYSLPVAAVPAPKCDIQQADSIIRIDKWLINNSISALEIQQNTTIVSDTVACNFVPLSHKFFLSNHPADLPLFAIKTNKSRLALLDAMAKMERNLTNGNSFLSEKIIKTPHKLYWGTGLFDTTFFNSSKTMFFTVVRDYLLFAQDKTVLVDYLLSLPDPFFENQLDTESLPSANDNLFYASRNTVVASSKWLPKDCPLVKYKPTLTTLKCHPEDGFLKISVKISGY